MVGITGAGRHSNAARRPAVRRTVAARRGHFAAVPCRGVSSGSGARLRAKPATAFVPLAPQELSMPRLACAPAVAFLSFSLCAQGLSPAKPPHGLIVGGFVNGSAPKAELTRDRILVRLGAAVDGETLRASVASVGLELAGRGGNGAFEVLRCDPALTEAWIQWLGEQPGVVYAERDPLAHTETAPNDPFYAPYQWNFYNTGTLSNGHASNFGVQAEAAWASTTGAGVTVAVVDTGIA
jgi:hypothetical protein